MKIDWTFLDTFNQTAFKGWSAGWLWIYTGLVWGAATILSAFRGTSLDAGWLLAWLGGLAAYSGISAAQYGVMRKTDYGALERQATIEAAKATPPGGTP